MFTNKTDHQDVFAAAKVISNDSSSFLFIATLGDDSGGGQAVVGSGREGRGEATGVMGVDLPTALIISKAERQHNEVNKLTTFNKRTS